jgi:hypothetical protein
LLDLGKLKVMKKSLFLLLLIPILSYSQITYKDVMGINSEDTFKKVVIENGYEFDSEDENGWFTYGLNIKRDSIGNKSSQWIHYKDNGEFSFNFVRTYSGLFGMEITSTETPYDSIVEDIKKNCKYYKIINVNGTDYVTYSCSQSTYKGKIGFVIDEGWGVIRHIIPTEE